VGWRRRRADVRDMFIVDSNMDCWWCRGSDDGWWGECRAILECLQLLVQILVVTSQGLDVANNVAEDVHSMTL
jgi:hypothetical protein